MLHLFGHPPLLLQYFSLLVHQRPLLLAEEPLQLLDFVLLAPEGLNQLLLALRQGQLQHKSVLRGKLIVACGREKQLVHISQNEVYNGDDMLHFYICITHLVSAIILGSFSPLYTHNNI